MDNQDYWNGVERRKPVRNDALEAAEKRIAELEQDCKDMGADYQSCGQELYETGCKLDEAHKRIAELESACLNYDRRWHEAGCKLDEAERKLAVARKAMTKAAALECNGVIRAALAQIGGDDAR